MCQTDKTASHSNTYSSSCSVISFVSGLCSAAWLRGPERAKLANSLEDLYVWVHLVIFHWWVGSCSHTRYCFFDVTLHVISVFPGSTWGSVSSICGWKKSENSLLRHPRVQKLVSCGKTNLRSRSALWIYIGIYRVLSLDTGRGNIMYHPNTYKTTNMTTTKVAIALLWLLITPLQLVTFPTD